MFTMLCRYIEEPIPVEEYWTPGIFNILCKDGLHHLDHHQSKRRSSRGSSVASVDEDRHHHHRVVETVVPNGVHNVDSAPKEAHTRTNHKTEKAEEPTGPVSYPPIKVPEEAKDLPKPPAAVPGSNPTTTTKDGQPLQNPNNPIPPPSMPIKEHEGPRNRRSSMRHDSEDELPAINDPFSLVLDRQSSTDTKLNAIKTNLHHEAEEHAKPVVPIPATTTTKDQQPTKIAGTPTISKPKDQHHEDHQHVKLATAGAIKPTDQQHEDYQIAVKTPPQAGKPKEKVAAPPAVTTPASSNNTKDQHVELKQHQQRAKGHQGTTPVTAAAATKSSLEHGDHHEPLKNVPMKI